MKIFASLFSLIIVISFFSMVYAEEAEGYFYITAKSGLRLREQPSTEGKIITTIPFGEKVFLSEEGESATFEGVTDKWLRVEWSGTKGWIFGGFTTGKRVVTDMNQVKKLLLSQEWGPDVGMTGTTFRFKGNNTFDSYGSTALYSGKYSIENGVVQITITKTSSDADGSLAGKSVPLIMIIREDSICYRYKLESADKIFHDTVFLSPDSLIGNSEKIEAGTTIEIDGLSAISVSGTYTYNKNIVFRARPLPDASSFEFSYNNAAQEKWSETISDNITQAKKNFFSNLVIIAKLKNPDRNGVVWYYVALPLIDGKKSSIRNNGLDVSRLAGWIEAGTLDSKK